MKDDKRRKALKALAIGAPAVWAKPVVDSVVLPAHGGGSPLEDPCARVDCTEGFICVEGDCVVDSC